MTPRTASRPLIRRCSRRRGGAVPGAAPPAGEPGAVMSQGIVVASAATAPRRGARFRARLSERPLLWIAPLAFLLFASYIYPALEVIRFSFTDATLLNPDYDYTLDTYS